MVDWVRTGEGDGPVEAVVVLGLALVPTPDGGARMADALCRRVRLGVTAWRQARAALGNAGCVLIMSGGNPQVVCRLGGSCADALDSAQPPLLLQQRPRSEASLMCEYAHNVLHVPEVSGVVNAHDVASTSCSCSAVLLLREPT